MIKWIVYCYIQNDIEYYSAHVTANKWMVCHYVPIRLYDMMVRTYMQWYTTKYMNGIQLNADNNIEYNHALIIADKWILYDYIQNNIVKYNGVCI